MIGSSQEAFDVDAGTPTLTLDLLRKVDAYWRAANFLSVVRFTCVTTHC